MKALIQLILIYFLVYYFFIYILKSDLEINFNHLMIVFSLNYIFNLLYSYKIGLNSILNLFKKTITYKLYKVAVKESRPFKDKFIIFADEDLITNEPIKCIELCIAEIKEPFKLKQILKPYTDKDYQFYKSREGQLIEV